VRITNQWVSTFAKELSRLCRRVNRAVVRIETLLPMNRSTAFLLVVAFAGAGFLLLKVMTQSSERELAACEERCRSEGKLAVLAPTGTAGRSIDGGRNWNEPPGYCNCVAPDTKGINSDLAR